MRVENRRIIQHLRIFCLLLRQCKTCADSFMLAAFEAVDLVVIFSQDTPQERIQRIQPSVLLKGEDYD
jgi:hypothetical protein